MWYLFNTKWKRRLFPIGLAAVFAEGAYHLDGTSWSVLLWSFSAVSIILGIWVWVADYRNKDTSA